MEGGAARGTIEPQACGGGEGSEEQQPLGRVRSGHSSDSLTGQAHLGISPFLIGFLGWMIMDVLTS